MTTKQALSFVAGFVLLFAIYHFPEYYPLFWVMALFKIGFLLIAFITARAQGWKGLGGFGLAWKRPAATDLLKGLLAGMVIFTASFIISILAGFEKYEGVLPAAVVFKNLPMLLLMTVIPSVDEDILTRGYLFGHLAKWLPRGGWVLISAIVFLLNHIWRLGDGPAVLTYIFLMGLTLAYTVWQTRSLWLAFGIHWGSNLAFEYSNAFVKTKSLITHDGGTWVLAGCWAVGLVMALSLLSRRT
jgi:membrane protease YdiL (CAAX protease family)